MNRGQKILLFSRLAVGSAIACTFISLLLLLNYLQANRAGPLENAAMEALLERLEAEPDNEALKVEIRNLDLLARKAFFNTQWQLNTGAILLLIGALIFGISLNALNNLTASIEMPEEEEPDVSLVGKLGQRGVLIGGATLTLLALAASFFTQSHLEQFEAISSPPQAAPSEEIEIIEVAYAGTEGSSPQAAPVVEADSSLAEAAPTEVEPAANEEAALPKTASYPGAAVVRQQYGSFRGPFGNGIAYQKNIPTEWNGPEGQNILWKTTLTGKGNNSPIIWDDQLFLAAASKSSQLVFCYNRHSGALLWQKAVENIPGSPPAPPKTTDDTGLSAPTLATDGLQVYAIFATGDVAGLDMSGETVWSRNLGVPDNHYGHSSSLQTWQGKLFVQYDTNKGCRVMALDCSSGKTLWETQRNVKISWASPILAPIGGKYQLILSADPLVCGYDTDSGAERWCVDCMMGEVGPSPAFGNGLVFAANEYARLVAIRPEGGGTIAWETNEYLPEVASPAVADGLLYIATSYGVLACYDATKGDKLWEFESDSGFYASPVIADGRVYALNREGVMHILRHDKEMQLVNEPPLGERTVATPAFANSRIYLRGEKHLYCIGN